ncbi:type 1 pili tip component [Oceanicoccus sagamiensis]
MSSMKVKELLQLWETTASGQLTREEQSIRLPVEDAAKLQALAEMYPRRSVTEIVTDLLSAALDDVESSMPYVSGKTVVARDEQGDPLFEDVGPTPKYLSLTKKHLNDYLLAQKDSH